MTCWQLRGEPRPPVPALTPWELSDLRAEARKAPRRFRRLLRRLRGDAPPPPAPEPAKVPAKHAAGRLSRPRRITDRLKGQPFLGVRKNGTRFVAYLQHDGRKIYLGSFATAKDAAVARDRKAVELKGAAVALNFAAIRSEAARG